MGDYSTLQFQILCNSIRQEHSACLFYVCWFDNNFIVVMTSLHSTTSLIYPSGPSGEQTTYLHRLYATVDIPKPHVEYQTPPTSSQHKSKTANGLSLAPSSSQLERERFLRMRLKFIFAGNSRRTLLRFVSWVHRWGMVSPRTNPAHPGNGTVWECACGTRE